MELNSRRVYFYELMMSSSSRGVENPGCRPIADLLNLIGQANLAGHEIVRNAGVAIDVVDWQIGANYHAILINKADMRLGDVAYRHFVTNVRRPGDRQQDEAIEHSCHVVIKPITHHKAVMTLTMGAGITTATVTRLLGAFARLLSVNPVHAQHFFFLRPGGENDEHGLPAKYKVRYKFSCAGFLDNSVEVALNEGRFRGVDLIAADETQFDQGGNLQIKEQSLSIKATNAHLASYAAVVNAVRRFVPGADYHYRKVRFQYANQNGDLQSTTVSLNELEQGFVRRERVELGQPVETRQTAINDTIVAAMLARM